MCPLRTRSFLNDCQAAILTLPIYLLLSPLLPAQAPSVAAPPGVQASTLPATPDSSASSLLSTNVDEVSLDLTVRTKHNKPVLDLQPSQLTVSDAGSPVQLSSLRLVAADSGSQHLVTLVFDHLGRGASQRAHTMAGKILEVFPEKGFSFAVLQVNGRLRLLQPYTQDRRLVDAAIADAIPATPALPLADLTPAEKTLTASENSDALAVSSDDRADGKLILTALEESQRILEERHGNPSLAALQALVESDRLLTGRKFILYFSEGITSGSNIGDAIQSILGQANRAGVTICVVDTNSFDPKMASAMDASAASSLLASGGGSGANSFGVGGMPGGGGISSSVGGPGTAFNLAAVHNTAGFEFGDVDTRDSPLVHLTYGTGGIYIGGSGGYNHQLQQLHEELTSWYQASWAPPIKKYDGEFRPIDIHSLRKDVVIHARSGYFAVPPAESTGIRPFEMPLLNILAGSSLPTDIAFQAGILHLGELPDGNAGELMVQVPISQLAVHEDANTHISAVHASIVAIVKDSKGAILQRFGQDFPLHETPDMFRADSSQMITLEQHFSADPGVYTLEAAVMDRIANKAGAQSTTFTVEPPAKGAALSDLTLVESVKPIEEEREPFEPMRFGDGHVVPNLSSELPADTRSLSLFFLVHPVAGSQSQPVLHMQIFRNGELLTEMPMALDKVSGTGAAIPYLGTISGDAFAPGDYQVKALLSQGGSIASSSVSFSVEGNSAASNAPNSSLTGGGSSSTDATDSRLVSEASTANSRFVISSPKNPIPLPTDAEKQAMIEGARQRALAWSNSLVNFYCYELTNHSVDAAGSGDWRHKDTLVELMRYVDHGESRSTVMLNGDRSDVRPDQLQFAHSAGEFGAMFQIIFNPSAKAVFTWKQSAFIDGQPVQVFAVKVARANSGFDLSDRNGRGGHAGFHGLVYLDPATLGVRRISIDADDIPPELLIRASSMSIDYSWVSMQDNDFLLPVRGAVSVQETRRHPVLNEFEFLDYRRFGSQSRVLTDNEVKASKTKATEN
jgi:VWFA-related protein